MTTTDTVRRLCAALDAGDDAVLPILADALEDAGEDVLAAGLRLVCVPWSGCRKRPRHVRGSWGWRCDPRKRRAADLVSADIAARLPARWAGATIPDHGYSTHRYPTRSAAYLALAAALTP